ncbi:MAG: hypothetical protein EXX96DRAFT_595019 [Benjaminiella poitrasii]|nr:MAG: hypothetical protein EXX96DRAFT_595019 [Benjaminiella poitrasii]
MVTQYNRRPELHNIIRIDHNCSIKEYKKNIRRTPNEGNENEVVFDFLQKIFDAYYDIYSDYQDLEDIEATLNHMLLYPFLKTVAKAINKETSSGAVFKTGEAPLQAMKKQIDDPDNSSIYYADGIINFHHIKQLEGLFGVLVMLKTVADEFYLASVSTFSKLKLFFVHASGKTIYLWSMRFIEERPAYELWLEREHKIKSSFEEKVEQLPESINFFWTMRCLLQQTEVIIRELEKEHKEKLKKYRFSSFPSKSLSSIINPSILKLIEKEDKQGMSKLGPFYHK